MQGGFARFLAELRRRRVFRVAAWYGAVGWVLIQFATSAFPALSLPPWTTTFIVVLVLVGFPIALLLAWAFEITPDGGARRTPSAPDAPPPPPAWRGWSLWAALAAGALLGVSGLQAWNSLRAPGAAPEAAPSLAVLPFENLSSDPEQEYFSDGLAEQLLDALTAVPELRVIARTSSFSFKGKAVDIATIASTLGVSHVLEGSVRKAGSRVRITAQLIRASDSSHLWSKTYDRELDDIFRVQDEIAEAVAHELQQTLVGRVRANRAPRDTEAYTLYLQARHLEERRTKESLEKAVGYYQQALARDQGYGLAWAGLASAYVDQANYAGVPLEIGYERARTAVIKALELDPNLAGAHAVLGRIQHSYDWDWAAADASFQRALALDPGDAEVVRQAGRLAATLGRFDHAIDLFQQAAARDPLRVGVYQSLGNAMWRAGRLAEAAATLRKALELGPERGGAHAVLAWVLRAQGQAEAALAEAQAEPSEGFKLTTRALALHALGRVAESEAALQALVEKYAHRNAYQIAEVYADRGDPDQAFAWLDRAYAQRDGGLTQMKGDPLLRNLVADPRHGALLRKMKLPAD